MARSITKTLRNAGILTITQKDWSDRKPTPFHEALVLNNRYVRAGWQVNAEDQGGNFEEMKSARRSVEQQRHLAQLEILAAAGFVTFTKIKFYNLVDGSPKISGHRNDCYCWPVELTEAQALQHIHE